MKKRILPALLALVMVLGMLPLTAFAEDSGDSAPATTPANVAKIGETGYTSLNAAFNAVTDNTATTIELTANVGITEHITVSTGKNITLDLAGHDITVTASQDLWTTTAGSEVYGIFMVRGGSLTIKGSSGSITAKANDTFVVDVVDGSCTLEGNVTYTGNLSVAQVERGTLTVTGGTFKLSQKDSGDSPYRYMLNCIDENYESKSASIEVKGGAFHGFNPGNNLAEGEGTNFLAPGYTAVKGAAQVGGADVYTVKELAVSAAGFIWDKDDTAAKNAVATAGGTAGADWMDQTLYVVFNEPLGAGQYAWISVEIGGATYGWACVGDATHKTYAASFLNQGQTPDAPEGGLSGAAAATAKVTVYQTSSLLEETPENPGALTKLGEENVNIPKKPTNANPNLKITSVTTDAPLYAKVKVEGMESGKAYLIRIAKTAAQKDNMVVLVVDGVTEYSFYCNNGQNIWVFEVENKATLSGGTLPYISIEQGTAQKIAVGE